MPPNPDHDRPAATGPGPGRRRKLVALGLVLLAVLAVWLWVTVPLALGQRTLFFRDVLDNHFALKAFGAAALEDGEIPAVNPTLGLGQPFRGNPSALAFYPGNALYLLLPLWSAFNLHFALHWLLALVAMTLLARRLEMSRPAALLAGLTYAGGGWYLSTLTFYNLVAVAAWWPLAMAGAAVVGGRRARMRGVALGGGACGMALLAGEPVTAALAMLPLLLLAVQRHGWRRGWATAGAIGALGTLVAAPQVVATARILGSSLRGSMGVADLATHFSLPPARLLELVLPLPFGWPLDVAPHGWWLGGADPAIGYYLSLYAGVIGLWLALRAARHRPGWAILAAAGLAGAVLLAMAPELVLRATGGLFRYPEKLLVWYALALPLLAGHGLDLALRPTRSPTAGATLPGEPGAKAPTGARYYDLVALLAAGLSLAAALGVAWAWPGLAEQSSRPDIVAAQAGHLLVYLAATSVLLVAGVLALRRRAATVLVLLQLLALLQLYPLLRTTPAAELRGPAPWNRLLGVEAMGQGAAVFHTQMLRPPWDRPPPRPDRSGTRAVHDLRNARELFPAPGVVHGLTYPLEPNREGLASLPHSFAVGMTRHAGDAGRLTWLRALGVDALVSYREVSPAPPAQNHARLLDVAVNDGVAARLYAIDDTAPRAWWPRRLVASRGARDAFQRVEDLADPVATVVAAEEVEHDPDGAVELRSESPDRLELDVVGGGGLLVVRRAFSPLYEARIETAGGDLPLATQPANLALLGIVTPPGEHRVVVGVDDGPVVAGLAVSLLALLAIGGLTLAAGRRGRSGVEKVEEET